LTTISDGNNNRRENSNSLHDSPALPWLLICGCGLALGLWGWGSERRMPYSVYGFLVGLILWIVGLSIVLPWWANR
jgi:hypothetical protein